MAVTTNSTCIIIGQGLAGTALGLKLYERNIPFHIYDQPHLSESSKIAAGLINPVVLKRLRWVKGAEHFFPEARLFYEKWEKEWNKTFYEKLPVHHIFKDAGEQNHWTEQSGHGYLDEYLGDIDLETPEFINAPHGVGKMKNTAWLDTVTYLKAACQFFLSRGLLTERQIDVDAAARDFRDARVILANGHRSRHYHPALEKAFAPTRGELLLFRSDVLPEDRIYHRRFFILPLGKGIFKVGATYAHDVLEDIATKEGKSQLLDGLWKMINFEPEIVKMMAGVRPTVADRRPLLGKLGGNLYIFNGMGSRGALQAPQLAGQFIDYLLDQKPISEELDVRRFTEPTI